MANLASSPLAAGLGLVLTGALLKWLQPGAFDMPKPTSRAGDRPKLPRNAREVRDGVATAMPDNFTDSIARTFFLVGGALIVLRAFDEIVDDEDRLFGAVRSLKEN